LGRDCEHRGSKRLDFW
jgi:hypothetical protein